jgi:signal transduction histidine kinase/CheY-like chemotaxis protein
MYAQALWFTNLFITAVWQTGALGAVTAIAIFSILFLRYRMSKLKNEKAELVQQVNERSELLKYAVEREKKAKENALVANKTKSSILARINHEVRTPLNGILGMVSLLNETSQNSEQREYSDTIKECGDSLLKIVNDILFKDILDYAKVESGKMELTQSEFDLANSLEEVLDVFASKAGQRGIELLYRIAPDVPRQIVGDHLRLQQILMNLVENSMKFTHQGEILISISPCSPVISNAVELAFEVTDTGVGMTAEKLQSLSMDARAVQSSGTGVGLVLCKKLVELMGGKLKIESLPEKGTTVSFTMRTVFGLPSLRAAVTNEFAEMEGKKVIVVSGRPLLGEILKTQLEQWKVTVVLVNSGNGALKMLSDIPGVDLVITDSQLPEMTGVALAEAIKMQHPQLSIMLMATADEGVNNKHPQLFNSLLIKPLKKDALSKQILSALVHSNKISSGQSQQTTQKLSEDFSIQHPLRILIAEDNQTNQKLAIKVLNKLGYKPDVANHGKEVLEVVSHKTYDLILMDVQMPYMDGLEASRMIRLCLSTQPVIIAMTANTLQGDREECLLAGMDDYISKPVNLEDLVRILEKWAIRINEKQ